ncbi:glycosyltransferase family 2 protein [Microbacterium sp. SL62]|uniref:glycosyltransferase family 2 protein n=1 Tax=Microbacterium sp. SL62 TaxID=2995139 RepID=UPI002273E86F|nr:glycosyltransferase family 2 protein [Microbacterium sp. SL62]MCY1716562.1 glycosyltransferase family 2 protein [Microbacterium sp. SL62]
MRTPRLSVVIPAYNNGKTIAETIRSILADGGDDIELVVADHSSTDDTLEQIRQFASDDRVTILETPSGGGAPRNWNRVTESARGELLKLVCGDDIVLPGTLRRQMAILEDPSVSLTACRRDIVDAEGKVLFSGWGLRGIGRRMPGHRAVRAAVRAGSNLFGEPASVMMRRSALEDAGGWRSDFPYLIDQATYSRVLFQGDFVPDLATGATFRMSATQWSVVLVRDQATQAKQFHRALHAEHPRAVSAVDVMVGNVRATLMARARQVSYWMLKRRMR